jgi:multiple sugar transport system permease protein
MKKQKITVSIVLIFIIIPFLFFPLYIMIIGGFKSNIALMLVPPDLNPFKLTLNTYAKLSKKFNISRWFFNSILASTGITVITAFVAATGGYAFAKKNFAGKNLLFTIVIATMIVPRQILLVPNYIVALKLHLTDSIFGLIITSVAAPFGIFLCKQFMGTIPDEMIDAAVIDGCSQPSIFSRIIIPLSYPVIGSLTIFTFIASWNDFLWQFILINSKANWTMPIAVASFVGMKMTDIGYQMAVASISAVPMVIVFIIFQKFFIKGLTVGAIKG